jgi:hypothetical protein
MKDIKYQHKLPFKVRDYECDIQGAWAIGRRISSVATRSLTV